MGVYGGGCSRTEPPAEKEPSRTEEKPAPRTEVGLGTLMRDGTSLYEGRIIQTTATVVSNLERNGQTVVRLAEPGAPPEGANMFCVLAEPPAALPIMGESIVLRGNKRGSAITPCWIVLDAGR